MNTRRTMARLGMVTAGTAALLLTATGVAMAAPATTTGHAASPATRACTSADLQASFGPGEGAAGTTYYPLNLLNTSDTACVISGFPGIAYADPAYNLVGDPAQGDGEDHGPVVLLPNGSANAIIGQVDYTAFDSTVCQPTPVSYFFISTPDESAGQGQGQYVELPGGDSFGCTGHTPSPQLTVTAVAPGVFEG
ncbi:MAG TPA: DUF4232 domain-containing protein [Pseudonocardiaceae bacterium]